MTIKRRNDHELGRLPVDAALYDALHELAYRTGSSLNYHRRRALSAYLRGAGVLQLPDPDAYRTVHGIRTAEREGTAATLPHLPGTGK